MREIDRIRVAAESAAIYEHGWQSWSPSGAYPLRARPPRPGTENSRVMNWRPDTRPPADAFWGEGLLAVDPGDGSGIVCSPPPPEQTRCPRSTPTARGRRWPFPPTGPCCARRPWRELLEDALGRWADGSPPRRGSRCAPESPTVWCSWYHYFRDVTEDDIFENLAAMDDLGLSVDVVQIDDGYQAEIGDWLTESGRFASLAAAVARIRGAGRRAGLWLAPFLVSPRSRIYPDHPEWLRRRREPGQLEGGAGRTRRHPPWRRGVPAHGLRHAPPHGDRLLQARLPVRRGAWQAARGRQRRRRWPPTGTAWR